MNQTGYLGASNLDESDDPEESYSDEDMAAAQALAVANSLLQFSKGLWQIFLGSLSVTLALALYVGLPLLKVPLGPLQIPALVASLAGVWMIFSGKQMCWSFSLPMQKKYLLTWSFGFDVALLLLRMFRRLVPNGWLTSLLAAIFSFLSIWFLLSFIAHLADTIQATWEKRLARLTQFTLVIGSLVWIVGLNLPRAPWGGLLILAGFASFVACFLGFLALCAQMSYALKRFAHFLTLET